MFKNLTYRKKNRILILLSFVMTFIAYQLAISDSLDLRNEYLQILSEGKSASNAPAEIKRIKQELTSLDLSMGNQSQEGRDVQQEILESLTHYCKENKIKLTEFPKPKTQEHKNYRLNTNHITLEGSFLPILNLIHKFENEYVLGKIISVNFGSDKKRKTKKKVLYATIYLQNIQRI